MVEYSPENYTRLLDENYRLKLGLGVGLGAPLVVTSAAAIGMYIYFSSR